MADGAKPQVDLSGRTLGDYSILRKLGSGGMGQVYLARQLSLKRDVALKLLRDDLAKNDTALKRFQAEAEAVARINHPNIVQVYAIGEHDGLRFMALEFVAGRNLRDFLSRKGPPELPVALTIMKQVAAALQRAGEQGIVHRDIKPENILLTRKAEVKVTDFGLSRLNDLNAVPLNLTQSGVTLGTPLYMAPEQVQGKPTDHRSDLYSLGVTYFHLLAGEPPFQGTTAYDVAMKHCTEMPPALAGFRPDLPTDLIALVHKLLAKNPAERYATAKDVVRDLTRIQKGQTTSPGDTTLGASLFQATTVLPMGPTVPGGTTLNMPAMTAAASPWPARILGMLTLIAMLVGGWWLFGMLNTTEPIVVATGPGLPELTFPESIKIQTTRERDLISKIENRQTPSDEFLKASIDLGLLYIRESRYEQARKVFDELEKEKPDGRGPIAKSITGLLPQVAAAKFGQGIVLAHQDKPDDSNAIFVQVVQSGGNRSAAIALHKLLLSYPELSQAISEAIQRNMDQQKGKKLPQQIEWLRSPSSLIRGRDKS
jgi:eukaryotic-like serine/threonine-protein kinase